MMTKIKHLPLYGGQALIEGVLMRGSSTLAAAFRTPSGEIAIQKEQLDGIYKSKIKSIPFLRGLIILWDSLVLGTRYLTISANYQGEEEEKIEGIQLVLTLIFSLVIAVAFFFVLPALISEWLETVLNMHNFWSNLFEGVIRLILVVAYIWVVGKIPEIKRVFSYHGAEHKTINAFESGTELTVENIQKFSVENPRCGTAFLLTLIILSILVFVLLGPLPILWRLISRIVLLPVLAGFAYEFIRWTGKNQHLAIVQWLMKPNLALQHLTTAEPDDKMVEVALAAFNAMLEQEEMIHDEDSVKVIRETPVLEGKVN
jgi:uncharacterized protein YqhQ